MNTLKDLFYFTYKEKRALIVLLIIGMTIGSSFFILDQEGATIKANDQPQGLQKKTSINQSSYEYQPKYKKGILVDLKLADSTELKMIPGI